MAADIAIKEPCRLATTENISLSAALTTCDGRPVNINDRILVNRQTDTFQNGIYIANSGSLTRATDFPTGSGNVRGGTLISVIEGERHRNSVWRIKGSSPITVGNTIGSTPIPIYKLEEFLSVTAFGAVGDGVTDDSDAIQEALNASGAPSLNGKATVYFPATPDSRFYRVTRTLTVYQGTRLVGEGREITRIRKEFPIPIPPQPDNTDPLLVLQKQTAMDNIWLDGASRKGPIVRIPTVEGYQNVTNCKIVDGDGPSVFFDGTKAGSSSNWENILAYRSTAIGEAIVVKDFGIPPDGYPISFVHLETDSKPSISFGSCSNFYVSNSTLAELTYSASSRDVTIVSSRIAPRSVGYVMQLRGSGNIVSCDLYPPVEIVGSDTYFNVGPNLYNSTVKDLTGNGTCHVFDYRNYTYVPQVYGNGVAWTIPGSNGTYRRLGNQVSAFVSIPIQSGTVIQPGNITIKLPFFSTTVVTQLSVRGRASLTDPAFKVFGGYIVIGEDVVHLERDGGAITNTNLGTLGVGAFLQVECTYSL